MKKGGCKKKAKSCPAKPKRGGRAAKNKKRKSNTMKISSGY